MGYRISYGKPMPQEKKKWRKVAPVSVCLVVVMVVAVAYYFQNEEFGGLMQALFTWTRPTVQAALSQFADHMEQGIGVGDAVTAFCREIIYASNALR